MRLSIVTTLYHSAPYLEEFHRRISRAAETITDDFEIILVNDGSPDNSLEVALALYEADARVCVVDLSRNFGHHKALMTGLAHAQGDLVFMLDVDLEEPPELLTTFHEAYQNSDADVVYGVQSERDGSWSRRLFGAAFYSVFNLLSEFRIPRNVVIMRLMSRRYVQQLIRHQEHLFLIAGLWEITGFKQIPMTIDKSYKGSSTYTFRKKLWMVVQAITTFSNRPLIYIAYLGLLIVIPSALYIIFLLIGSLTGYFGVDGWTSLIVSVWFLGGLIIFILGIIAIYLSVIFVETKPRPYTIVRQYYTHQHQDHTNPSDLPILAAQELTHHDLD